MSGPGVDAVCAAAQGVFIDAGVAHLRLAAWDATNAPLYDTTLPSGGDLRGALASWGRALQAGRGATRAFITGKLAPLVRESLGCGSTILPAAAAWLAARDLLRDEQDAGIASLAILELSASGYLAVGVERGGALKDDLLVVNPRCGAGSGINLDRVLQKLGLGRGDVDEILAGYAGEAGRAKRERTTVRADRCGVFSSSATISDKNQGIPLDVALATTLKSEVHKACRKLPGGFDAVCLTGRVFHWRFARECAEDWLRGQGVRRILCDPDNEQLMRSLRSFVLEAGTDGIAAPEVRLQDPPVLDEYPSLAVLKRSYEARHRYLRLPDRVLPQRAAIGDCRLHLALDVGSTMAKAVLSDADGGDVLWLSAYSNAGDTIETIKRVFRELAEAGWPRPALAGIGITGSARYQVQQALEHIYPELAGRVIVLVENYAHARGSIALAREHAARLKAAGVRVNEDFCVLVDIGGEDTKVSTIALREAELFGNAMNLKCSAGTGSLMDTLSAMFGLGDVAGACAEAFAAPRGIAINATCAVFLMENARKLQLQGVPRDQILASANWAIVENMARTLWNQLELPGHAVVLLHGQTMLSEPLPVAVTHRLQSFGATPFYALVPPNPGHRGCLGLISTLRQTAPSGGAEIPLARFLDARFDKRIVQCHGAACEDKSACCNRSTLTCRGADGRKLVAFTVGGCSAINELLAKKKEGAAAGPVRDTYKEIWDFLDSHHPRDDNPDRLVIPRSFAVSEWAYLLARLFQRLGIPVHVDNVRDTDLVEAQPLFNVDCCAPQMGAVGQYRRLAGEAHRIILAPQIEYLPTGGGGGAGRTCTVNQGGVAVAMNLARLAHPQARFHLFNVDLSLLEPEALRVQLQGRLQPVFASYGVEPAADALRDALAGAIADHLRLRAATADLAADMAEEALAQGTRVAVVAGREYILNPGIFDSQVRRLLRDKRMAVLPSYVLDLELDADYAHIYWRNPHFLVSLMAAAARRELHLRLRHPRLRRVFEAIESGPDLLPVVQVSTFSCGPDSVVQPFVAEIMRQRPFLLIQSDAVIKELAHLENRVNTYVKQLELGLHQRLNSDGGGPFDVRTLDDLVNSAPIDPETDVVYLPTLGDNRAVTAALRAAGYTCIDNFGDDHDLRQLVRAGRQAAGDAVCAPLAAVYADLERAVTDFARRRRDGDPLLAGKQRLLYFDNKGNGPCRQGQYVDVHRLLFQQGAAAQASPRCEGACPAPPGGMMRLLVGSEADGYDVGFPEWAQARIHLGIVLHGVLDSLLFAGGAACRDYEEYRRFLEDYRALKTGLFLAMEGFEGPGRLVLRLLSACRGFAGLAWMLKLLAYRARDRKLSRPLRRFSRKWIQGRVGSGPRFRIFLTGEAYMRVAQAVDVFQALLANLGFRRFELQYAPAWSYLEWLLDDFIETHSDRLGRLEAGLEDAGERKRETQERMREARILKFVLHDIMARPLYRAAGLPMPASTRKLMEKTRELISTLRPQSEITAYVGEALEELRHGADLVLNVGPSGCMVACMGESLTPAIAHAAGPGTGRIQHLLSADGDVNDELLTLALLKAMGPERYYRPAARAA